MRNTISYHMFSLNSGVFVVFIISPICTLCHIPLLYCVCNIIYLKVLPHFWYFVACVLPNQTKSNVKSEKSAVSSTYNLLDTEKCRSHLCVFILNVYVLRASTLHIGNGKRVIVWHGRTYERNDYTSFEAMVYLFLAYWIMW